MCTHLLLQELQTVAKQQLTGECWIPPKKKKISPIQGQRRSPSKIVEGLESHLESNSIPARDPRKAPINSVCIRTQRPCRDSARTVFECLLWRCGSQGACHRARGSGCSRSGYGTSPLGGGCH